jgi:hypothetical protein
MYVFVYVCVGGRGTHTHTHTHTHTYREREREIWGETDERERERERGEGYVERIACSGRIPSHATGDIENISKHFHGSLGSEKRLLYVYGEATYGAGPGHART